METAAKVPSGMRSLRTPYRPLPCSFGNYTLFDHIGRGGMADLYLAACRTGLGETRLVVVKEVLKEFATRPRFIDLLISEAKLSARLNHANIVSVEDLGCVDGSYFLVMEYVEGFDLRDLLKRCARDRVALPIEYSLLVVSEILKALDYAHRSEGERAEPLSLVHRDVSPSNVLLSFEGEVKLCDFGIARAHDALEQLPDEAIVGKAGYMSPEHAYGEELTPGADIFAAGIILWELLSGRKLYKASTDEPLLEQARRAHIPPLVARGLPHEEELHAVVWKALQANRNDRYISAGAMLEELEDYMFRAGIRPSHRKFGAFLRDHFGGEIIANRRERELLLSPERFESVDEDSRVVSIFEKSAVTVREEEPFVAEFPQRTKHSVPPPPPPSLEATTTDVKPVSTRGTSGPLRYFVVLAFGVVFACALYYLSHR